MTITDGELLQEIRAEAADYRHRCRRLCLWRSSKDSLEVQKAEAEVKRWALEIWISDEDYWARLTETEVVTAVWSVILEGTD